MQGTAHLLVFTHFVLASAISVAPASRRAGESKPLLAHEHADLFGVAFQKLDASAISTLKNQERSIEQKLAVEERHINAIEQQNGRISAATIRLRKENERIRNESEALMLECEDLGTGLQKLMQNVSSIKEHLVGSMKVTNAKLGSAPELDVLKELAANEKAKAESKAHSNALHDIMKKRRVALLQTSGDVNALNESKAVMESLAAALANFSAVQSIAATKIQVAYERQHAENAAKLSALLEEQTQLNATRQHERDLRVKLARAEDTLIRQRRDLLAKSIAVRRFVKKVARAVPSEDDDAAANDVEAEAASAAVSEATARDPHHGFLGGLRSIFGSAR